MKAIDDGFFGKCRGCVYTIEFQKRGLPHIHILIFLYFQAKYQEAHQIDKVISAQLPDPETQHELFKLVEKLMIHGPCGTLNPSAPCMKDGKCSKGYPKPLQDQTVLSEDGYTIYARPSNGHVCKKKVNGVQVDIDNKWVVPYNPWALRTLRWHANMECSISVKAFKYLHKYIYKGHDCTTMAIGKSKDEIEQY